MARASTVKLSITSAFDPKGTRAAENAMKGFERSAAAVGGSSAFASGMAAKSIAMEKFGSKMSGVGTAMVGLGTFATKGLTVPIIAATAACVGAASNMESAFANVRKTVDATDEEYQRLYDSAIELSTAHPIAAADVAIIQSLGAQLGISTSNLDAFAEVIYGLDIATDLDAETAATQLAQFANICGTAEDQLSNVGSTVVALGNTSATTESTIMGLGMRLAASGTQAGMSESNILAISAALGSLGMEAEAGGTAMSTTLNQISVDVAKNNENVKIWADLTGQSIDEFSANWAAGGDTTTSTFAKVIEGMARTSDEGGNLTVLLEELGITGIRQSDAMKRLASSGDLLAGSISTANTAYSENSALTQEVANFEDTFASKLEVTKNKATAVAIEMGGPLLSALGDVLDSTEPLIDAVSDAAKSFSSMDEEGKQTVVTVLAAAAAFGPLMIGTGKVVKVGGNLVATAGRVTGKLAEWAVASKATTAAETLTESATKKSTVAITAKTAATRTMATVMTAAKVAGAALAIAGIMVIVDVVTKAAEKQRNFTAATEGLIAATNISASSNLSAAASMDATGASTQAAKVDVDKLIESQAALAAQIQETNVAARADATVLEGYQQTIQELAAKSELGVDEQARLEGAIDGVNRACGTAYTVASDYTGSIYDQNGVLLENVDAINNVIDARQRQIQVEAYESNYKGLIEQKIKAEDALAQATVRSTNAQEALSTAQDAGITNLSGYEEAVRLTNEEVAQAEGLYNAAEVAAANVGNQMTALSQSTDETAGAFQRFTSANTIISNNLTRNGQDLQSFQGHLEQTGVSVEQLEQLSTTELGQLAASYDGTFESVQGALTNYEATAPVSAQAAASGVKTLTEAELVSLPGTVQGYADGMIGNYNGALYRYDAKSAQWVANSSTSAITGVPGMFGSTGANAVACFGSPMSSYTGRDGKTMATKAKSEADSVETDGVGFNFTAGFAGGILESAWQAVNAAADMVGQAISSARKKADEASPSRVMKASGRNFTVGYAIGIEEEAAYAAATAAAMVDDTIAAASKVAATGLPELEIKSNHSLERKISTSAFGAVLSNSSSNSSITAAEIASDAFKALKLEFDDSRIVNGIAGLGDKLDRVCTILERIRDRQMTLEWNHRELARVINKC